MKVVWSIQAKECLQQTSNYIRKEFGKRSKQKFLNEVLHVASLLENNPCIGQVEPLLDEAPVKYRNKPYQQIGLLYPRQYIRNRCSMGYPTRTKIVIE